MIIETTYAIDVWSSIFTSNMEVWDFILLVISLFILAWWIFSIVFILWWGLLLILSGGKEDKIKPAINTIRYAVIGIIVTVLTIFLFPILGWLLWLDVERYAEPKRIFETIESLWNRIFKWSNYSITPTDINNLDTLPVDYLNDL